MRSPIILGIYGSSNTGKTILITKLIQWLTKNSYKVATIKISDKPITIDTKGKDTDLHKQSGASLVVFSSPIETTYLNPKKLTQSEIIEKIKVMDHFDIILIEGASDSYIPKIRMDETCEERPNTLFTYTNIDEIKTYITKKLHEKVD